jgi:cell division septal protein FtsQ
MQEDFRLTLDDGQVIKGKIGELTQPQIISLANQLRRNKNKAHADLLMEYQHKKFWQDNSPPEAA